MKIQTSTQKNTDRGDQIEKYLSTAEIVQYVLTWRKFLVTGFLVGIVLAGARFFLQPSYVTTANFTRSLTAAELSGEVKTQTALAANAFQDKDAVKQYVNTLVSTLKKNQKSTTPLEASSSKKAMDFLFDRFGIGTKDENELKIRLANYLANEIAGSFRNMRNARAPDFLSYIINGGDSWTIKLTLNIAEAAKPLMYAAANATNALITTYNKNQDTARLLTRQEHVVEARTALQSSIEQYKQIQPDFMNQKVKVKATFYSLENRLSALEDKARIVRPKFAVEQDFDIDIPSAVILPGSGRETNSESQQFGMTAPITLESRELNGLIRRVAQLHEKKIIDDSAKNDLLKQLSDLESEMLMLIPKITLESGKLNAMQAAYLEVLYEAMKPLQKSGFQLGTLDIPVDPFGISMTRSLVDSRGGSLILWLILGGFAGFVFGLAAAGFSFLKQQREMTA